MYLEEISRFVTFLSHKDHTLQEILNYLSRVIFVTLDVNAVSFSQLNGDNELVVQARSGVSKEYALKAQSIYSLDDTYPNVDALKTLSTIWIDTLPDWGDEYFLMKNFPLDSQSKTYIAFPIFVTGIPVAVMALVIGIRIAPNREIDAFLKAIGHILAMYLFRNSVSPTQKPDTTIELSNSNSKEINYGFTDRQLVILRLISENRTNLSISQYLGYSESTIRQDIMKIFTKLGCSHRSEAAALYRSFTPTS